MQRSWRACGAVLTMALGCGAEVAPSVAVCGAILHGREPTASVIDHLADGERGAILEYEVGGSWWRSSEPAVGRLACRFETSPRGRLRLYGATLDGVDFTRAEIAVINADLLLGEMQLAGREAINPSR